MARYFFSWNTDPKECNQKTGPIPQVYVSQNSCPTSCSVREYCYAKFGPISNAWKKSEQGIDIVGLRNRLALLTPGQMWRYGVAGDLPGVGDAIDSTELTLLTHAAHGLTTIAYTHKPVIGPTTTAKRNREAIRYARELGLSINLSADSLSEADTKAALEIGPVVVTVPQFGPYPRYTPGGRSLVVCPAVSAPGEITCLSCKLCAVSTRQSVVAFPAHGSRKRAMSEALTIVE